MTPQQFVGKLAHALIVPKIKDPERLHWRQGCLLRTETQTNAPQHFLPGNKNTLGGVYSDLSQTSHCNIKGLSVREVMRIENMITQVKFY